MISFIVIGKNIENTVDVCFSSILNAIQICNLEGESEIIYVDSKSTDSTIDKVKAFKSIEIYQILGKCNAAVARNIGAKESKGQYLFFLDGDMELISEFLISSVNLIKDNDFISGDLLNYNYDSNGQFIDMTPYFGKKMTEDKVESTTGGVFFIKKDLWNSVNGMRSYLKRSQDLDLGLRLAKKGKMLKRKKDLIVNHHTVSYFEQRRIKDFFFNGNYLYVGVLDRLHLFNPYFWAFFLRKDYSMIFLLLGICCVFFYGGLSLVPYLILIFLRVCFQRQKEHFSFIKYYIYFILRDLNILFGFLFFYPKDIELSYKYIDNV